MLKTIEIEATWSGKIKSRCRRVKTGEKEFERQIANNFSKWKYPKKIVSFEGIASEKKMIKYIAKN